MRKRLLTGNIPGPFPGPNLQTRQPVCEIGKKIQRNQGLIPLVVFLLGMQKSTKNSAIPIG